MRAKLLSEKTAKAVCTLLMIACIVRIVVVILTCVSIAMGNVRVEYVDQDGGIENRIINGEESGGFKDLVGEVSIGGEIDGACRAAVIAMGINKYLPEAALYVLLALVCLNGAKGRLYSRDSVTVMLWCAIVPVIDFIFVSLLNVMAIPLLAGISSQARITVRDFKYEGLNVLLSLILILGAHVLDKGRRREKKGQEAQA